MKNELVGIIVDSGHGGLDSGAVGNGLLEKDLTLEAGLYMYDRLKELGIPTEITRVDDSYLPKSDRIEKVLELYNNSPNTILVSNHINSGNAEGAEIIYALRNDSTLADLALDYIGEAGQIKRKTYQRRLPENPNKDYYYILRESGNTEPILVEYGFIDNTNDAKKLQTNLKDYVEGVVKALCEYTGYPYYPPGTSNDTYTVKKGDTLYSISKKYNIPVETLKRLNNLTTDTLYINQVLKLKEEITTTTTYKVTKDDTLYSISNKYNISVDELKKLNNLTSNTIYIGQELKVPETDTSNYKIYKVAKGDSLWAISRKYDIPVNELIEINNLTNLTLQIGQELLVPNIEVEETPNNTYIVTSGDTLWTIAKNNNITVDELKNLNNLSSNLLTVGQVLIIK
jgi:LysM repeat protein